MTNIAEALRVLLIEDNKEHAKLIERHISRGSRGAIELILEETLSAGLQRLRAGNIDALLLDLRLPDSSLEETLPRTLAVTPLVPIIVLSSLEDSEFAVETIHSGAQDYLCKSSLSDDLLIRSIRNAIERKRIESAATKAKEDAEAANAAKDRFFAALSHELRTPLTPALMICSSLEKNEKLDENLRESISIVRRSLEMEVTLINDLLDFTQLSQGEIALQRDCIDLRELLQHVIDLFVVNEAGSKQLRFESVFHAQEHHVLADAQRMQQVFANLCKNALKFTPPGGAITLRIFNPTPDCLSVEIVDTGIGIADAELSRLSTAFEQGKVSPLFGGLGLGLTVARSIVEAHEGTISIASPGPGKGATFRVDLKTCPPPINKKPVYPHHENGPLRILLVEDHAMTRQTLARLLSRKNYIVKEAVDVESAKQAAEQGTFDLLISDLGLPDGNGREVMHYVHARFGLRGIAFSGFGMEQDIEASHRAGFAEHLTKPVEWAVVDSAILRVTSAP